MHESLVVIMMILSPVGGGQSSAWYDWKPGGYYPSKAACEDMATAIYRQQKILAERTSPAHQYLHDRVGSTMIGHVCGNDPKPPVKK